MIFFSIFFACSLAGSSLKEKINQKEDKQVEDRSQKEDTSQTENLKDKEDGTKAQLIERLQVNSGTDIVRQQEALLPASEIKKTCGEIRKKSYKFAQEHG